MKQRGIVLHGNVPLDNIYVTHKYPTEGTNNVAGKYIQRPGGIANLVWAFRAIDPFFPVEVNASLGLDWSGNIITDWFKAQKILSHLHYTNVLPTSSASIVLNSFNGKKTSTVHWGACKYPPVPDLTKVGKEYSWHHFAYIDIFDTKKYETMMPYLGELRDAGYTLSADVAGVPTSLSKDIDLSPFHYVFMALEDKDKYNLPPTTRTWGVFHNPSVIYLNWSNNGTYIGNLNPEIINCVGAGDILAAVIIHSTMSFGRMIDYNDLGKIYELTERLLLRRQW